MSSTKVKLLSAGGLLNGFSCNRNLYINHNMGGSYIAIILCVYIYNWHMKYRVVESIPMAKLVNSSISLSL